jgi:hypothetical protein
MEKKDTKYYSVVFVGIWVDCYLYKLAHSVEYLHGSKLFDIGKSIVYLMLREFVHVINVVFKNSIQWQEGHDFIYAMDGFKDLCGLPLVVGAIDVIQVHI